MYSFVDVESNLNWKNLKTTMNHWNIILLNEVVDNLHSNARRYLNLLNMSNPKNNIHWDQSKLYFIKSRITSVTTHIIILCWCLLSLVWNTCVIIWFLYRTAKCDFYIRRKKSQHWIWNENFNELDDLDLFNERNVVWIAWENLYKFKWIDHILS